MEYIKLENGISIPMVGFGVYQIPPEETKKIVLKALKNGYRLVDTAQAYMNESEVGKAIHESEIARDEIFITTKLWVQDFSQDGVKRATELSLKNLGVDYIDLILLHQPMGDYFSAWRGLEDLYSNGIVKSIGVSNFYPNVIANMAETVKIRPMINQVEIHPFFQQNLNLKTMKKYRIIPQAWAPFNEGRNNFFNNEILKEIGDNYGKSVAQVAIRWNLQRGVIVIPKSTQEEHIAENINVFDFELSEKDMEKISKLDKERSEIVNHFDPEFVSMVNRLKF